MLEYLRYITKQAVRLSRKWNRINAAFWPRLSGGTLALGNGVVVNVPLRIDGRGAVVIGDSVMLGYAPAFRVGTGEILLQARGQTSSIRIGNNCYFSNNIGIIAVDSISIGDSCQIGDLVMIVDADFHEINPATRNATSGLICPVTIGNNVWLGSRVIILKGTTIGDNSVIAAGSVVTKPIPENVIAAGVPAKVIRHI